MSSPPIDYDALAAQHGGTPTSAIDYDALAAQHGGTVAGGGSPPAAAPMQQPSSVARLSSMMDPASTASLPAGSVSAQPDQSYADKATAWAQNVASDLKNGTDVTGVGSVLKKLGAHGLYSGNSQAVGDFMGSLPLGLAKMAQGAGETGQGNVAQGAKDVGSGALQAATIPSSVVAPEAAEATAAGAGKVASTVASKVPVLNAAALKESAGGLLQSVAHDANQVPVKLDNAGDAALSLMNWQKITQLGPTINKFLNRVTNPKLGPLTYEEGRDFYQVLGKMSAEETMKLAPAIRRDLTQMVVGLKQDLGNAADTVGRAADYYQGMQDYATGAKYQKWYDTAKDFLTNQVVQGIGKGVGIGAGTGVGYQLYKKLQSQ